MQKIVLFIEPSDDAWMTPFKAGHLFMNRFTIGEEANFEIVKIFELAKSSWDISNKHGKRKGMSLSTLILFIGRTTQISLGANFCTPSSFIFKDF